MTFAHRAAQQVGRRGGFLCLLGLCWALVGYSLLPGRQAPTAQATLKIAAHVMPVGAYGVLWIGAGLIMIVIGCLPVSDVLAFCVAITMPTLWACVYFAAWLHHDAVRGWITAVLFAALASAIAVVSGMPNPLPDAVTESQ